MRILIAGPPKSGNVWLKCLLASIYGLERLRPIEVPEVPEAGAFKEWVAREGFRDGTIFHQHYEYSDELRAAVAAVPAHLVTIVRDPYDMFVSVYFNLQAKATVAPGRAAERRDRPRGNEMLVGKPLDHPDVLAYLEDGFRYHLVMANDWVHRGGSTVVRYEHLHRDPVDELRRATGQIQPGDDESILSALDACSAANMRQLNPKKAWRIRVAAIGDWKNHLTETHLAIFARHADLIRSLGYEVR